MRTRETFNNVKTLENKGESQKSTKFLLAKDTYNFSEKLTNNQVRECTYDVEFIILKDLRGKHSLCSSDEYKNFYNFLSNTVLCEGRNALSKLNPIKADIIFSEFYQNFKELNTSPSSDKKKFVFSFFF